MCRKWELVRKATQSSDSYEWVRLLLLTTESNSSLYAVLNTVTSEQRGDILLTSGVYQRDVFAPCWVGDNLRLRWRESPGTRYYCKVHIALRKLAATGAAAWQLHKQCSAVGRDAVRSLRPSRHELVETCNPDDTHYYYKPPCVIPYVYTIHHVVHRIGTIVFFSRLSVIDIRMSEMVLYKHESAYK